MAAIRFIVKRFAAYILGINDSGDQLEINDEGDTLEL